ncbi:MAG: REP-associated tyrosine transposase [Spirochaetia bacterium]
MHTPREIVEGADYHVVAKVNRDEYIFEDDKIKDMFLSVVARAKKKYLFEMIYFTIMGNHVHMILTPSKKAGLSKVMQWILSVFAQKYNRHKEIRGHLFHDRFWSKPIHNFKQFMQTFWYVANNPVKQGMVTRAIDYVYGGLWHLAHNCFFFIDKPKKDTQLTLDAESLFTQA